MFIEINLWTHIVILKVKRTNKIQNLRMKEKKYSKREMFKVKNIKQ